VAAKCSRNTLIAVVDTTGGTRAKFSPVAGQAAA
jgi:hypothetical protein